MSIAVSKFSSREIREQISRVPHWYHRIEVAPGIVTPGTRNSQSELRFFRLPEDCTGMRALDIGARDGFFSFELEKRGAEVLAIDHVPETVTGLAVARKLLGSSVRFELANVYDLSAQRFGTFDIVMFLGVLYHLRNPLLALDRVRSFCKDRMWLESHVIDFRLHDFLRGRLRKLRDLLPALVSAPIMQFYPSDQVCQDYTNWWGPNMACLQALAESANFRVESKTKFGQRAILHCRINEDPKLNYFRDLENSVLRQTVSQDIGQK